MNRTALLATGAVLTLAAGSVFAASAATASTHSHTLVFHGTGGSVKQLDKTDYVEANVLHTGSAKGKIVGYSALSCNDSQQDKCSVSYALKGGELLGTLTYPITNGTATKGTGKITGGLGAYKGAKGTIKVVIGGTSGKITLKYTD